MMMLHNGRCGSTVVGYLLAQNPNIHWASELYTPLFAKWTKENQQEFAYLAKEPIVENPIEILKNSMNETTKPYYGFETHTAVSALGILFNVIFISQVKNILTCQQSFYFLHCSFYVPNPFN